jgi:hypothetical protein
MEQTTTFRIIDFDINRYCLRTFLHPWVEHIDLILCPDFADLTPEAQELWRHRLHANGVALRLLAAHFFLQPTNWRNAPARQKLAWLAQAAGESAAYTALFEDVIRWSDALPDRPTPEGTWAYVESRASTSPWIYLLVNGHPPGVRAPEKVPGEVEQIRILRNEVKRLEAQFPQLHAMPARRPPLHVWCKEQ